MTTYLNDILTKSTNLAKMKKCVDNGIFLSLCNLTNGEKTLAIHYLNKKCIVICNDFNQMTQLKMSLESLGHGVKEITVAFSSPISSFGQDCSSFYEFISGLFDFYFGECDILLASVDTLGQKLPSKEIFDNVQSFKKAQNYNFNQLEQKFIDLGYKRQDYAKSKGEFAIRGDIVDLFPINFDNPVRLDFFGDELENIYEFDVESMKKLFSIDAFNLYPATFYLKKDNILEKFNKEIKTLKINDNNYSKINELITKYSTNNFSANDGFILPFFDFKDNILSLFNNELIIFDEPKKIFDQFDCVLNNNLSSIKNLINNGQLLNIHLNFYNNKNNILNNLSKYLIFENIESNLKIDERINFRSIGSRKYLFDYKGLVNDIKIYLNSNYTIVLFCGNKQSVDNIGTYLIQNNLTYQTKYKNISKGQIILLDEYLGVSASFLECGLVIIGTVDLVKKSTQIKPTKNKKRATFYLPKINDYVVHDVHGIGKCIDIKKLNLNGAEKDYFLIEYKGGDILYVPSEQANTISAFLGSDKSPTLNKIGGQEFSKAKERVKQSVKQLAINLVELYSQREKQKGHIYTSGNYVLDEFENAFEYELTPDQQEAINDIKKDLYSPKVMDRLICGDVGYGKTEVALRCAYQVVLEGKQVAFLCPTTILSEQHYKTTKNRTKDFMCRVEVLNRFKSKAQEKQILQDLKDGKIDIICGTHRLLSKDVVFKDLGLLILDEEHRFGVQDKEKIKNLKRDIDVLTLSATPIPRTLNMAMTGIRDISIIETPPKNRLPVQTYVVEESDALIQDACKREMARGGQTLIVFNRVEKIYDFCEKIKQLLPNARIGLAHGQMPEKILEDVILKLYDGQYDILIATTLIENGIDLPLANTLIVIEADKLGLSQLYQLRGRIGRSDKLAYAYFTFNPNKILTQDAYKRLDAILEFTELGSGFKIAMRDLEIRGAGNILGKEQHGHMEKVGYDLYCRLLEDAVNELKGYKKKEEKPLKVDISCPAFMPDNYITGEQERIGYYSKISEISSLTALNDLKNELVVTFGELPKELENLLKVALIKNLCIKLDAKRILCNSTQTQIYLYKKQEIISPKCAEIISDYGDVAVLKFEEVPIINLNINHLTMENKLDFLINFLLQATND